MTDIKIEKNIPIPIGRPGNHSKDPWQQLEVGDSFLITSRTYGAVSSSRTYAQRKTGFKFTLRKVDGGVRVWRTK